MKTLILLLLILLTAACNSTSTGALSPDELAYLRTQASIQCKADSAATAKGYKESSDELFSTSASNRFLREQGFKWTESKGSTVLNKRQITVWKIDSTAKIVYFIITNTDSSSNVTYKFLRVTSDTNDKMVDDLFTKKCDSTNKILTVSNSTSAVSMHYAPADQVIDTIYSVREVRTYTYPFSQLAYFGRYHEVRGRDEILLTNNTSRLHEDFKGELVGQNETLVYTAYTQYNPSLTEFCVPKESGSGAYTIFAPDLTCNSSPTAAVGDWTNPSADL